MNSKDIDKILGFACLFGLAIVWIAFPWGWKEIAVKLTLTLCVFGAKENPLP
jgi:hypothetical protein